MSKFFKALQQAEQEHALRLESERVGYRKEQPATETDRTATAARPAIRVRAREARTDEGANGTVVQHLPLRPGIHSTKDLEEHLVSLLRPSSFEAEQYRELSHVVERFHETGSVKVVGLASPSGGDGKTVTAINLAGALAQDSRRRVLLLEADLRQPMIAKYLGLADSDRGLVQCIARPAVGLADAITRLPGIHFDVLPAGHPSASPYEALRSSRAQELFQEARQAYDYVVVDTPPLVAVPEARVIEQLVDGFLIVVRAHRTLRNVLGEALRLTDATKTLGFVFNGDDRLAPGFDRYYRYRDHEAAPRRASHWLRLRPGR